MCEMGKASRTVGVSISNSPYYYNFKQSNVEKVFFGPPELTQPYRTAFARYYTKYGFRNLVTLVGWRPRLKQLFDEKVAAAKAKEARTKAKPKPKPKALKRKAKAVEKAKSSCSLS